MVSWYRGHGVAGRYALALENKETAKACIKEVRERDSEALFSPKKYVIIFDILRPRDSERKRSVLDWKASKLPLFVGERNDHQAGAAYVISARRKRR